MVTEDRQTAFLVIEDATLSAFITQVIRPLEIDVAIYRNGASFLAAYRSEQPGCILVDLQLADMDGFAVQSQLQKLRYASPIIMLSAETALETAVKAMRRGAINFLVKPLSRMRLEPAILEAMGVDSHCRREREDQRLAQQKLQLLDEKELAVLEMLASGHLNKQIAAHFDLSLRTIELRRATIFKKLGVVSLAEMFKLVFTARTSLDLPIRRRAAPPSAGQLMRTA